MSRTILIALCLAASVVFGAASARADNLVMDGDFSADTPYAAPNSPPWTSNSLVSIDNVYTCCSDTQDAAFSNGGTLSQTLATVAGDSYVLDFWVLDEAGFSLDSFTVSLGTMFTETITGDETAAGYTEFTYTVPGADIAGNDTLSFSASNPLGFDWNLDDVSVTPLAVSVPEPPAAALLASALFGFIGLLAMHRRSGRHRFGLEADKLQGLAARHPN